MTQLFYAQPYDISAEGFYFRSGEDYDRQAPQIKNSHGGVVEEFEIQFIDGDLIDCDLAKAWSLNQCNFRPFIENACHWEEEEKFSFIIAVGECGYSFDANSVSPDKFDVTIYRESSMRDLAISFVDEGLFGEIPEPLQNYIDHDAIARDLAMDYSEAIIAGERLIYSCP